MDAATDSVTSEELAPTDSMEITTEDDLEQEPTIIAGAMEMTSESLVPYYLLPESKPSLCVCCGTTHDDNNDEGCCLARRLASRCARCGLVHRDYDLAARIMDDMEKFDCKIYIPDVKKLQMDGYTILMPENILKKLEEHRKMKQDAKKKQ